MPLPLRGDFDASQLRRFARRTKDGRRLGERLITELRPPPAPVST